MSPEGSLELFGGDERFELEAGLAGKPDADNIGAGKSELILRTVVRPLEVLPKFDMVLDLQFTTFATPKYVPNYPRHGSHIKLHCKACTQQRSLSENKF